MHFILHALEHSAKLLPWLLLSYILIEVIEYFSARNIQHSKLLSGKWATLFGAGFGLVPQCGFSVVATDLFASHKIKIGTLLAVYIATSDEAIPLLIVNPDKALTLIPLLIIKFLVAIIVGYLVDLIFKKANEKHLSFSKNSKSLAPTNNTISIPVTEENNKESSEENEATIPNEEHLHDDSHEHHEDNTKNELHKEQNNKNIEEIHDEEHQDGSNHEETHSEEHHKHQDNNETSHSHHTGCCGHEIEESGKKAKLKRFLLHPLIHTLKIFAFILIINIVFEGLVELISEDSIKDFLLSSKAFAPLFSALVGLIPNCASSVVITELYAIGGIGFGAYIAGLIVNAGIGFIVLFKQNKNIKQNFAILGGVLAIGIIVGYIIQLIGF